MNNFQNINNKYKSYCPVPMVPGPVTMHPEVGLLAGADYGSGNLEADYRVLYRETSEKLACLMGTENDVVLLTGEAMLALWAGLKNVLKPGDRVVSVITGIFGEGIADMAESIGAVVERINLPYDTTISDLSEIEKRIKAVKPLLITAVHCDTPSGTLNPLAGLGALKKELDVPLFYVDAVASLGGAPVEADKWNIDFLLCGAQKCLSATPGECFLSVSDAAWDIIKKVKYQGYDELLPYNNIAQKVKFPYTPHWHGVAALNKAVSLLYEEGIENVFKRHEKAANFCREEFQRRGFILYPDKSAILSPTVTSVYIPKGRDSKIFLKKLRNEGLAAAGGLGKLSGKVFRFGHMGNQADIELLQKAFEIVDRVMKNHP
ncbi:MAG: aminotransferase class V-fold PLP-dependent enzyme [Spirochaetia bacterium]|nr:aminotransferase class V-fold PLP-dependent enzyme [Spirochaetia bacterium]